MTHRVPSGTPMWTEEPLTKNKNTTISQRRLMFLSTSTLTPTVCSPESSQHDLFTHTHTWTHPHTRSQEVFFKTLHCLLIFHSIKPNVLTMGPMLSTAAATLWGRFTMSPPAHSALASSIFFEHNQHSPTFYIKHFRSDAAMALALLPSLKCLRFCQSPHQ